MMDELSVRVRTDGNEYEDVLVGWLSLDEDFECLEQSQKKVINQKLMTEDVQQDMLLLRKLRLLKSVRNNDKLKHPLTIKSIGELRSLDARKLLAAFDQLNDVTAAEKSSPEESRIGGAAVAAGLTTTETAAPVSTDEAVRPDSESG